MTKDIDKMIREYLARIGSKGGKARAARHDKATLSRWARKGGRPPKAEGKQEAEMIYKKGRYYMVKFM